MAAVDADNLPETITALSDVRRGERLWWYADRGEIVVVRDGGLVLARLPAGGVLKALGESKGAGRED